MLLLQLGYIPGLNFRYGKSYSRAADDSMYEFSERQTELRRKWQAAQVYRANSAPKMNSIRARDDVSRSLKEYEDKVKFKGKIMICLNPTKADLCEVESN